MATPKWFDANAYMQNKLAQLKAQEPDAGWTLDKLYDAFREGGFVGAEGQYEHFVKFGAAEEVAPNAYFNADEYYAAKAKQYYEEELKQEFTGSEEQIASVKALIKDADMNAWTHYQQFGSAEGVNPSNAFDASDYCAAKAAAMIKAGQKAPDGTDWTAEKIAKAIDDAGMSVLEHYLTYAGTGEGEVAAGSTYPVSEDEQVVVPNPGKTVVVDGSATTYTGTAGDDKFYLKHDSELHEYNTLDGGEGNDTLILDGQGLGGATIRNIENLVVRQGAPSVNLYDLSAFSSSFTLEGGNAGVKNVTSQKLIADGATKLTVNMAAGQTSVDLANQNRAANHQSTFELKGDSLTSVKLAVDEGAAEVNFADSDAKVTDLAVTATVSEAENDKADVNASALTNLANVTVAGAGAVKLTVDTTSTKSALKAVDATANTGGVEVDLSDAKLAKVAFTGGDGDDSLKLGDSAATHTLGAGDDTVEITQALTSKDFSVDGGKGTDTLMMTADIAAKFTIGDVVKNFEILKLNGSGANAIVDMNDFGGINHVVVGNTLSGLLTINNVDSDGTIEFTAAPNKGVTVTVTDADKAENTSDVLNVTIAAASDIDANTLTVTDVETINITADDTDFVAGAKAVNHKLTLAADSVSIVKVDGDAHLTLSGASAADTIDASESTGGVTITGDLNGTTTFKGGAGNDAISAAALTVTPATEKAVLTFDDFKADDTIQMGATATGKLTELTVNSTDNWASIMSKIESNAQVWFQFGGATYVAVNGASVGIGANDYIVKLSGTDIDLTEASFTSGSLSLSEGA